MPKKFIKKQFFRNNSLKSWLGFSMIFLFFAFILYASHYVVNTLRADEKKKVENIKNALELLSSEKVISDQSRAFALKITQDNTSIPLILIDEKGEFSFQKNLDQEEENLRNNPKYLAQKIKSMAEYHQPLDVNLPFGTQKIYYEKSFLLSRLQSYPYLLISILLVFMLFSIWYFSTIEAQKRSFLWAGMAKETAHQIGTPLSSLLGWIELLKLESLKEKSILIEMQKDVHRLNLISERFSKIGSEPELKKQDLVKVCEETFRYLKQRISSKVAFTFSHSSSVIYADINAELLGWVIENLVKNALDAMKNEGELKFILKEQEDKVRILIQDNGPGIPQQNRKNVFKPGFTTKKRGWGLGLSLAKRIVEDYHRGQIFVLESDKNGTTFQILLPKIKN